MLYLFLILSAVCTIGKTLPLPDLFSYSPAVGGGSGSEFSTAHEGHITGIRAWEYSNSYITGLQLRYDSNWTTMVGQNNNGHPIEMELYDRESIVQISGKHNGYVYELVFGTNLGRFFKVGQPSGTSFNFYPTHRGSEVRFLSGRQDGNGITSIGAHWAIHKYDTPVSTPVNLIG
ncbi:zymogen granule membrane protein 16-like [Myxocyprinus asiaticus]|uniref:zymogen granule membrane protein 16-like n=1 Tax=Myxocyprinus asiaticus TaxID=70543 RepID=UPI002221D9DE|nr:zymogen granule membrane protein 16-like [Myxocyprinus asiaticus]